MRWAWLGLLGVALLAGSAGGNGAVTAAPLAQATATATITPTPTATLPPFRSYGNGWGVQSLPAANMNCFVAGGPTYLSDPSCVAGTPIP